MAKQVTPEQPPTRLIPLSDWDKFHTWPTVHALRAYVYDRASNGFDDHGVYKRVGRRILIDEAAFFRWVDARSNEAA